MKLPALNSKIRDSQPKSSPHKQHNNPLHGLTLEAIVIALETYYGWDGLAERIPVRCFSNDPSISSSLKFLRKTPWAREKVEALYIFMVQGINQTEIAERPNSVD